MQHSGWVCSLFANYFAHMKQLTMKQFQKLNFRDALKFVWGRISKKQDLKDLKFWPLLVVRFCEFVAE